MKNAIFDLTFPQKNIWELEQVSGNGTPINHIMAVLKFDRILDEFLMDKVLNKLIKDNDSFRLKFVHGELGIKQYIEPYSPKKFEIIKLKNNKIDEIIEKLKGEKITIDDPYIIWVVYTPSATYLLYKVHHIISDAWSVTQLAEQVKDNYNYFYNNYSDGSLTKPSYLDFKNREIEYINSDRYKNDEEFWTEYAKNIPESKIFNELSEDKKALRFENIISKKTYTQISDFCKANFITEYSFFLAVLALYFSKQKSTGTITFGTAFLNRQKKFNELAATGMYISTLPLAINTKDFSNFIDLCKSIAGSNISLFKHSKYPYHKIQEIHSKLIGENVSLFEIGFSYQINDSSNTISNVGTGECSWVFSGYQNTPLTIHLTSYNEQKKIMYDYWDKCFTKEEIQSMNDIVLNIIDQVLDNKLELKDISLLTKQDIKLLKEFNNTGNAEHPDNNVITLYNKAVKENSNRTALSYNSTILNYTEFNNKVNSIAKVLGDIGISNGDCVALCFDKSIEMITSIFAILKIGAFYVPILPDETQSRIQYILNDCNPKCVLTHKNYNNQIKYKTIIINLDTLQIAHVSTEITAKEPIKPDDVAYMIYTSGSSGNPKGTMVTHKNIYGLMMSIKNDKILRATNNDVSLSLLKYSFDASGIDIYTSILFGGKLVLVSKENELNPEKVIEIIQNERVTRSFLIPKWIEQFAIQDKLLNADLSSLKILGTGGDPLKPHIAKRLFERYKDLKILNLYGPTETTMFSTYKVVGLDEINNNYTSIGKPIWGSRACVVNSKLELLPINSKGELIIYEDENSIHNISNGYLNLDDQTIQKFVTMYNPITDSMVKAYRTGDIVKINSNLEIEFLGRNDDVVKVNGGYLVALNEVEKKIQNLLGADYKICTVAIPYKISKAIILFIVPQGNNFDVNNVKNYINGNISFYMKPKKIIVLDEFPTNSSGKIDRKRLTALAVEYMDKSKSGFIAPKTKTEIAIYNYLVELLGTNEISANDDFIDDLGVDSLSLTALYTHLSSYNISIQDLYNNSTIKDLADYIDTNSDEEIEPDLDGIKDIQILNNVKQMDLSHVLLTGVTGFLGIHLLKDLLFNDKVQKVYCIIRSKINKTSEERLEGMLEFYYNSDKKICDLVKKKVVVVDGNIALANLGLDQETYKKLTQEVTTVINSAANVKHFVKYQEIMHDNVESVKNIVKFCNGKISLAQISTLSISGYQCPKTANKIFTENHLYYGQLFDNNPYLVSKFNAEKIILSEVQKNGLNASIFRLGNIMPRFSDGVFQKNANQNVFLSSLKSIIDARVITKEFLNINLDFSPVDVCSKMIVSLLDNDAPNTVYHILNDKEISMVDMKALLKFLKVEIKDVDLTTFIEEIDKYADEYTKEYLLGNTINKTSQIETEKRLKEINLAWPEIDIDYIQKVLDVLNSI